MPAPRPRTEYLDDRRRPLHFAEQSVVAEGVGLRASAVAPVLIALLTAAIIGWAVYSFARNPQLPSIVGMLIGLVPAIIANAAWRRLFRPQDFPPLPPLAARLAAHRFCGGCGYDLHQVEPEGDACVVCPECGAAWNVERFVRQDEAPRTSPELRRLMGEGQVAAEASRCDDRGDRLDNPMKWPPLWINTADHDASAALTEAILMRRRSFLRWVAPVTLACWGCVATALILGGEREYDQAILILVVTALIALIAAWAALRMFVDHAALRCAVDVVGLCANCGRRLRDHRAFDGCAVCSGCKRAWKRNTPPADSPDAR